jgi:hypothetical protein
MQCSNKETTQMPGKACSSEDSSSSSSKGSSRGRGWLAGIAARHPLAWHVAAVQVEVGLLLGTACFEPAARLL